MSSENEVVVRRLIEGFLNTGDEDIADAVLAAGYVDHNPSFPGMSGIENIKRSVGGWHAAFPDTRNEIEDVISRGDRVVVRWTTRATHRGRFMGAPPTGNRITVTNIGVFRLSAGRILESWDEYDALGLLRQLGVSVGEKA